MSRPKHSTDLTKSQSEKFAKLIDKPDRTEKENETIDVLLKKRDRFLNPPLSETAKSYLIGRYSKERYDKRRAAMSAKLPRIAKGTGLEDEAMLLLSKLHKIEYTRPDDYIKNDFLHGKCDILCAEHKKIVEMKISWSASSFFPYLNTGLPKGVWFQTQGYLELYNLDFAQVCYILVNTPRHLIDQEYANLFKRYTFGEINREKFDEGMEKIEGFYNYDNIPSKRRVITFEVTRSPETITEVRKKVVLCREWLNDFERQHMGNKKFITLADDYINAATEENNPESDTTESLQSD